LHRAGEIKTIVALNISGALRLWRAPIATKRRNDRPADTPRINAHYIFRSDEKTLTFRHTRSQAPSKFHNNVNKHFA
jgi:hypothetical protein